MSATADQMIRSRLEPGDAEGIVELHRRVYAPEYGMNDTFVQRVGEGVRAAVAGGWPERAGAVRLVDGSEGLAGCVALTDEGDGSGRIRWVVLASELRGSGLGRRLVTELVEEARAGGMQMLKLETFSALSAAARIYRDLGFRVVDEFERFDWGPPIVYQHYELALR
jgi:ribosomal protein S18 acetylase RimI-like enzyme